MGDNIVVFDYISADTARVLAADYISNVLARVRRELKLEVTLQEKAHRQLIDLATADTSKGGRGIGLALESGFVNPLARALFAISTSADQSISELRLNADGTRDVILQ